MMPKVLVGNLFDSRAQTLVNTVNCVGVMGKGIALEFKRRYPEMFRDYQRRCAKGEVRLGRPYLYRQLTGPWILLFPTKDHWRSVARLENIVAGLEYLKAHYREWGIASLAVPPLGCGQGGLDWSIVGPTLFNHLQELHIPVELYAPYGTPINQLTPEFLANTEPEPTLFTGTSLDQRTAAWVAAAEVVSRIENSLYHWPIGRVVFHKILYFLTEAGLPTGLTFSAGSYGPYSKEARGVLTKLVNNGLVIETKRGQMFRVQVGPSFPDARKAYSTRLERWSVELNRTTDLFKRVTTHQAEVAATVHFAAMQLRSAEDIPTENDVLTAVMDWKKRRHPKWTEKEVALTVRYLNILGWIDARGSNDLPTSEESLCF